MGRHPPRFIISIPVGAAVTAGLGVGDLVEVTIRRIDPEECKRRYGSVPPPLKRSGER